MLKLSQIVGQESAVRMLHRFVESGRLPRALIFHGPEAVGKTTCAEAFVAQLACTGPGDEACGACSDCRLIERGHHPDLTRIGRIPKKDAPKSVHEAWAAGEPVEEKDLRKVIVVDQIRDVSSLAPLSPRQARYRFFVIEPADLMNAESQNALLKTLEDPPGASIVILVTARPHLLLPTVRSRCVSVGFGTLDAAALAEHLRSRGLDAAEAGARAALSQGRPGLALELDLDEHRERRDAVLAILEKLGGRPSREIGAMAAALAGKDDGTLHASLDMMQGLLRDVARLDLTGRDGLVHADLAARLTAVGRAIDGARAARLVAGIDRLRATLRVNANRALIAESVLAAVAGGPLP